MTRLRRALGRIAVAWLLCQAGTLSLAPVLLWAHSAEELIECTCTHGDHAICPMHHKPEPSAKVCLMKSADEDRTAVLTTFLVGVGLLPAQASVVRPESQRVIHLPETATRSLRPAPPDPPPPRA